MKYFMGVYLGVFLLFSGSFAYEPTEKEVLVLEKIEVLADELTDQSLEDLKVPLISIVSQQDPGTRNARIAREVLDINAS